MGKLLLVLGIAFVAIALPGLSLIPEVAPGRSETVFYSNRPGSESVQAVVLDFPAGASIFVDYQANAGHVLRIEVHAGDQLNSPILYNSSGNAGHFEFTAPRDGQYSFWFRDIDDSSAEPLTAAIKLAKGWWATGRENEVVVGGFAPGLVGVALLGVYAVRWRRRARNATRAQGDQPRGPEVEGPLPGTRPR